MKVAFNRLKKAGKWNKEFTASVEKAEKYLKEEFPWMR